MRRAAIVAAARTPLGRARKGRLATVDAWALARTAVGGVIERSGIPAADIDDIVLAESMQGGPVSDLPAESSTSATVASLDEAAEISQPRQQRRTGGRRDRGQ